MYHILIVDSEERHLKKIKKVLEVAPKEYGFYYTSTPEGALSILEKGTIDVFICELELSVMSGEEMFYLCRRVSPDTMLIALSKAEDIRKTLEAMNRTGTFKLILKPCGFADDILIPVKEALKRKEILKNKENEKEEKRQELVQVEQNYRAVIDEIQERKAEYEILLDLVMGFMKYHLETAGDEVTKKSSGKIQEYIRKTQEAFIKYYILEPKEWKINERLWLEEFHHPEKEKVLKIENLAEGEIPPALSPNVSYAVYLLLELVYTHLEAYESFVQVKKEGERILLSLRCSLDASKDDHGRIRYRTAGKGEFEKTYKSTIQTLRLISRRVYIEPGKNPYAVDVLF